MGVDTMGRHEDDGLVYGLGSWGARLGALAFFLVLSVLLTFPLVLHLRSAVPGPPWDNLVWLYDLWWLRHSIVDLGEWPTFNATIFYPYGYDLRLSELMLPNKVLIAPLLLLGDEVLAYNGLLLLSFILTGYATYVFVTYLSGDRLAALIAGVVFAFCSYRMHAMAAGWLPLISTQWIPLAFLYVERMVREHKARYAIAAGFFTALNILSSWYYLYVVVPFVILYVLIRLWPWYRTLRRGVVWRDLALMAAMVVLLVFPVALPVLRVGQGNMGWSLADVEKWAASLEDFFIPNVYHPLWGSYFLQKRAFTLRYPWYAPGFVYLGWPALFLAVLGLLWKKGPRHVVGPMAWMGGLAFVMALGVVLHWNNTVVEVPVPPAVETFMARAMSTLMSKWALHKASYYDIVFRSGTVPIPLPALLVYLFVPLGDALRTLYRFGVITMFSVAVLAGLGVARLLGCGRIRRGGLASQEQHADSAGEKDGRLNRRRARRGCAAALLALVLVDLVSVPLPFGLSEVKAQPLDAWLGALPQDAVIMQFPLTRSFSGDALYRTKYHGRLVAYGHGTFYPQAYREAMPVLGSFPSEESLDLLESWGVTHIVVASQAYDAGWGDLPGQDWATVGQQIAAEARLRPVAEIEDQPFWRDERVSHVLFGNPPVVPLLVDHVYIYELGK